MVRGKKEEFSTSNKNERPKFNNDNKKWCAVDD